MATSPVMLLTEEQYLAIEREAPHKSDFHDGRMFAMAGSSADHGQLSGMICGLLNGKAPASCAAYNSDVRVRIPSTKFYTYPDCSVVCGERQGGRDSITNPILIVEVLSPSTEAYDRGAKFDAYRMIESLREYLLIHQDRRQVELHSKDAAGTWLPPAIVSGDGSIVIPNLGAMIPLGELYAKVPHIQ